MLHLADKTSQYQKVPKILSKTLSQHLGTNDFPLFYFIFPVTFVYYIFKNSELKSKTREKCFLQRSVLHHTLGHPRSCLWISYASLESRSQDITVISLPF